MDNSNVLIFVRGERPMMDKKFDILTHPNVARTADGKAKAYTHSKNSKYLKKDLSFAIHDDLSNVKFMEVEKYNEKPEQNSENTENP